MKRNTEKISSRIALSVVFVTLVVLQVVVYYDLTMKIQDTEKRLVTESHQQALEIERLKQNKN